jgi:hypothetical protein
MLAKVLARLFLAITSREMFIALGVFLGVLSVPMMMEQWRFIREYKPGMTHEMLHEMEGIIDGLAGILVAAGVFMESRDTIRKMAMTDYRETTVEHRLNEVAHQNGAGILMIGLLMEIGTLLIGLPRRVLNTQRFEREIYVACLICTGLSLIILYDFVKDYLLTYRIKEPRA